MERNDFTEKKVKKKGKEIATRSIFIGLLYVLIVSLYASVILIGLFIGIPNLLVPLLEGTVTADLIGKSITTLLFCIFITFSATALKSVADRSL